MGREGERTGYDCDFAVESAHYEGWIGCVVGVFEMIDSCAK